jgi:secreted trypsin-like serine protease
MRTSILLLIILAVSAVIIGQELPPVSVTQRELPGIAKDLREIETLKSTISPMISLQALEILREKEKAVAIIDKSLSDAEVSAARSIADRSTRQLEIKAKLNRPQQRITHGRAAMFSEFQYQVALVFAGYKKPQDGQFCGGSLIDKAWILTAAHCLNSDTQPADIEVYVGSVRLSSGGRLVPIQHVYRHEQYDADTNKNDIALLELASPVDSQQPIDLVGNSESEASMIKFSRNATISGWGDTREGANEGSDDLLYATTPIANHEACTSSYAMISKQITGDMICAGNGRTDTCQGDSGGPLVLHTSDGKSHLEGVVSWGQGCAEKKYPGVYTRVPSYVGWIHEKIGVQGP